ncbi:unnamed protein product [Oikopleura dioica]|uniref:Phosphatidylserine synthase n=1 Tax=Oikopleura dioica TaxID=34765 RepID=E4YTX1_OIKDI|nr:unnamed protein product [Oikopleura dioica]
MSVFRPLKEGSQNETPSEKKVQDITINAFYEPHTLTFLAMIAVSLGYICLTRSDDNEELNIFYGLITCALVVGVPISIMLFPNGPFTRPHPILWRIVFGGLLCYMLALVFMLFCSMSQIRRAMIFIDPSLKDAKREIDLVESYAEDCSDISFATIWASLDIFAFAHFWGWGMKALMIRNYGICWTISVTWEITEVMFQHILPNFKECWWDHWILDVVVCNGGGIWLGMIVGQFLELRRYRWESVLEIDSRKKKFKRCLLQFTPESWGRLDWLHGNYRHPIGRTLALFIIMMLWQIVELNTFFSKHFFRYPGHNWMCWGRILFMGLCSMPAIKQWYIYVTDPRCKRLGNHCWLYIMTVLVETLVQIKFGFEEFSRANISYILQWVVIMFIGAFVGLMLNVYSGVYYHPKGYPANEDEIELDVNINRQRKSEKVE